MFNVRLRAMRIKRSHTQQWMADTLGIALRTYQCYETGSRAPKFDLLVSIADILDVSIDFLLGRDDWMSSHGVSFDEYL